MTITEKECRQCGEIKPLTQFSVSRQGKRGPVLRSNCKSCASTRAMKWFNDNRERADTNRRAWHIQKLYGITVERYDEILASQGGVCAICGQASRQTHGTTGTTFSLSVDHCHDSGRVRGILCNDCNRAIGLLGDNIELLERAIRYLKLGSGYNQ